MAKKGDGGCFSFGLFWLWLFTILIYARISLSVRSDKEIRERFYGNLYNSTPPQSNDTIAQMFDRVLEKEFSENDQPEGLNFLFFCLIFILFFGDKSSVGFVCLGRKFGKMEV